MRNQKQAAPPADRTTHLATSQESPPPTCPPKWQLLMPLISQLVILMLLSQRRTPPSKEPLPGKCSKLLPHAHDMEGVPMVQGNNVAQFKEKEDYNNWGKTVAKNKERWKIKCLIEAGGN